MNSTSRKTTNHAEIRRWVEERQGFPATVKGTTGKDHTPGVLRIGFALGGSLEPLDWDTFFEKFEAQKLTFLCQDRTQRGEMSRFFKFVRRD